MKEGARPLTLGLPRMHKEAGERRDFLPPFVRAMVSLGLDVFVESGIGSGMGRTNDDYTRISPSVHVVDHLDCFQQDLVLQLRCMEVEDFHKLRPGSTFISMIHFPTRPRRLNRLRELGVDAISLDCVEDDEGRRMVENMRAVAWNGLEAAFGALVQADPEFHRLRQQPLRVTLLGTGHVGKHAVEAATKFGCMERFQQWQQRGAVGVEVTCVGRLLAGRPDYMQERFAVTDVLVDATQRSDPSLPVVPNGWIGWLPPHAVICDLAVDPYVLTGTPPTVRGVEGIPLGNLDKWIFHPDDAEWTATIPDGIPTRHRRTTVTCYSWPGLHAEACMGVYRLQLIPLLQTLVAAGGVAGLTRNADALTRALWRASLRNWLDNKPPPEPEPE